MVLVGELWGSFQGQLEKTCKISGAVWAAYFERGALAWDFRVGYRMSRRRLRELKTFLEEPATSRWLAGALGSGRTRSRATRRHAEKLGCLRLFAFPCPQAQGVLLVGDAELEKEMRAFFRILAQGVPEGGFGSLIVEPKSFYERLEIGREVTYNLQHTLEKVLISMADYLPCQAAYLAIRRGDVFRIEAVWNCAPRARGLQFEVSANPLLADIVATGEIRLVTRIRSLGKLVPGNVFTQPVRAWMGVPLVLGNRVIGFMAFVASSRRAFSPADQLRAARYARQATPFVENAIALAEAGRHLQRLALLNELASAASADLEIEKVAGRVLRMLRRTFHTNVVHLLLLSSDEKTLHEYGDETRQAIPVGPPGDITLASHVVKTGLPLRIDDATRSSEGLPTNPGVRSELAVPLKYRGKVNGVLSLGSDEPNAFSSEDEQLLVVIASHLSGLLENIRLSEESRNRARNLGIIHQVVQRVLGLTEVDEIARVSAELMAERFGYELAKILLVDISGEHLALRGVGGSVASRITQDTQIPVAEGAEWQVVQTGASYLSNGQAPNGSDSHDEWHPHSRMCVPLREGDLIFGLIDVSSSRPDAFTANDLLVLESLAGFLSSVMMNARRYQQLQNSVRHLQAGRETALDIGADLDMDTLLKRVVRRTRELVGVKGAELGLVDEKEQLVRVLVSENPWNDYSGLTFPLMTGVAGRVAALGEPLVVNDYNAWSGRLKSNRRAPFNSVAGVPLKFKGQVIGTLTVYDDQPARVFGDEDVALLELVAPQVAVYIRHAMLYQELQERIQAQQLAERRLIQSARLAAVGEMAAGIAHELNNPLTTVAGFAELILDEIPEDFPQRPDLELILREAVRARGVVRRLLDFSRQSESVKERADINAIVSDVVAMVHHLARTSGVEAQLELDPDLPLVYVDNNQMKQVLLNFVHNALQAMPNGGNLYLKTARRRRNGQEWVTIAVRDTGEGIPPENMDRIFEPFFTTKPTGTGTGLGLSISYGIISDHGGFIEVDSEVGVGSCFTIWLSPAGEHVDA